MKYLQLWNHQYLQLNPEINNRMNDGIEVLDIGCGRGHAVNLMGKAFSRSKFTGCDISQEGITTTKEEAKNMGLTNVRFEITDALLVEELGKYDLITAFDTIHDQAQPTRVLKAINASLKSDGFFLMQDIAASSMVDKNIESIGPSTLYNIYHALYVSFSCL